MFAVLAIAALLGIAAINLYQAKAAGSGAKTLSYSQFLDALERGEIAKVTLSGPDIRGVLTDHSAFKTYAPADPALIGLLRAKTVAITAVAPAQSGLLNSSTLSALLAALLLLGVAAFFLRRNASSGARTTLGKSRAKLLAQAQHPVTFADVAGVDEAKDSLQEIVDFLRAPQKFGRLGGRMPKGILLVGPPGTGKTLLARAIAGEAQVPFFTISGSDFVDEIDAVGRRRGAGVGSGNDEREQTLNQLLVEMDGFEANAGVILIAATNRPDVLDPALLRPGRFDREIVVSKPDVLGRERILAVHTRNVPLSAEADLKAIAASTPGFSGADLMNLVNEAALLAARREKSSVGAAEFDDAKDTVTLGAERRSHTMSSAEKRLAAFREAGRALVEHFSPESERSQRFTIIARGRSAGMLKRRRDENQDFVTLEQMKSRLAVLMAGRAAEELMLGRGQITSAAAADIAEATQLATTMVTRLGLSEALGTVAYGEDEEDVFLGHSLGRRRQPSEHTAQLIAAEVRALIEQATASAGSILESHRAQFTLIADALMERESLGAGDIERLLIPR